MNCGKDLLRKYGFTHKGAVLTIIYISNYMQKYVPSLFEAFMTRNTSKRISNDLPVYQDLRKVRFCFDLSTQ